METLSTMSHYSNQVINLLSVFLVCMSSLHPCQSISMSCLHEEWDHSVVLLSMKLRSWLTGMNNYNVFCSLFSSLSSSSTCVSPSDSTLTVDSVLEVMGKVQKWEEVGIWLNIPYSKRQEIRKQSSTEIEKSHQVGRYWVNTDPDSSWEELGRVLYERGEETAAMMVKQYLPPQGMWIPEIRLVLVSYKIIS